jgi:hypothetical protein
VQLVTTLGFVTSNQAVDAASRCAAAPPILQFSRRQAIVRQVFWMVVVAIPYILPMTVALVVHDLPERQLIALVALFLNIGRLL